VKIAETRLRYWFQKRWKVQWLGQYKMSAINERKMNHEILIKEDASLPRDYSKSMISL
jgi:hypothetical protein